MPVRMGRMAAPRKYPEELRGRATRLAVEAWRFPASAVIVEYIDAHRDEFGVDPLGRVLSERAGGQIAPSSYYAAKAQGPVSPADLGDADDANTLFDLWVANRRLCGVRTLWHAARRADHDWGRPPNVTRVGKPSFSRPGTDRRGRHA